MENLTHRRIVKSFQKDYYYSKNIKIKCNLKTLYQGFQNKGGRSKGIITCAKRGALQKRRIMKLNSGFQNEKKNQLHIVLGKIHRRKPLADMHISCSSNGSFQLMLAPEKCENFDFIQNNASFPSKNGDRGFLSGIKPGTPVHNITSPWNGGGISRSRGESTLLIRHDSPCTMLKYKSGEIRYSSDQYKASIGIVSDPNFFLRKHRKAGYTRHIGRKPRTRPTAMNPVDHPLGGRTKGGAQAVDFNGKLRNNIRTRKHIPLGVLTTSRSFRFSKR
jgi:large subunit ribosomal protein L2